ncbi:MAG: SRPBCC family protein [Bacteroidales bacterium]
MDSIQVKGRSIVVKHPSDVLFALLTDLTNFSKNLPPEMRDKTELQSTPDTLLAKVKGFKIGLKVDERIPFSSIKYVQYGNSPFPFSFWVFLNSMNESQTELHLELDTELSGMLKMMLGDKLQEVVDKITDEVEKGLG